MRRIIALSRDTQKAMPANGVVYSPLGSRIPLASLIQALSVAEHLNFRHAAAALGVINPPSARGSNNSSRILAFSCLSDVIAASV